MNIELFTAFLLITIVLIIAPGPIVTLVISTGATRGVRAALRWTGAAYLIWLGVQAWRHAGEESQQLLETSRARFVRGLLVALSNPKTIVFFTAFLPQFIDPRLPAGPQLAAMCVASVLLALISDSCWAIASGMGRAWFMKPTRARLLGRASGFTLVGGGIWLSLARRP